MFQIIENYREVEVETCLARCNGNPFFPHFVMNYGAFISFLYLLGSTYCSTELLMRPFSVGVTSRKIYFIIYTHPSVSCQPFKHISNQTAETVTWLR